MLGDFILKFIAAISLFTLYLSANACVEEGKSVGVYPNAPGCCQGLELKPAPEGVYGSAGTCVKKSNCVVEGKSVGVYPNAPGCCQGLELKPAPEGVYGSAGTCIKKNNCVEEGKSVGVYPNAPDCCKGLELKPAPEGVYGSAGTCVASLSPTDPNVNNSENQTKDSLPSKSSPSKNSSGTGQ